MKKKREGEESIEGRRKRVDIEEERAEGRDRAGERDMDISYG